jgi:hypothetical protein
MGLVRRVGGAWGGALGAWGHRSRPNAKRWMIAPGAEIGSGAVRTGSVGDFVLGLAELDEAGRQWLAAGTAAVGGWVRWF